MSRILSISYDEALLHTRELMLRREGFEVESALSISAALHACEKGSFDLVIMGHSIPQEDKQKIITLLRGVCSTPVLALRRPVDPPLAAADYNLDSSDPERFRNFILEILDHETGKANSRGF
jgi:DNA-binding NtrC family response regulator